MVLEPSSYIHDRDYVDATLAERSPRLVVVETPGKMWTAVHSVESSHVNSAKQRAKRVREVSNAFLSCACAIADRQVKGDREFVLELPLDNTIMRNGSVQALINNSEVFTSVGYMCGFGMTNSSGERIRRPTWWLSSSIEMANKLESRCGEDHQGHGKPRLNRLDEMPDKAVDAILVGFTETMCRKDPRRMQQLRRAIDARIRGTGMFANEHMVHLANTVDKHIRTRGVVCDHHVHTVVDEKTDIPVGGIEFDLSLIHI